MKRSEFLELLRQRLSEIKAEAERFKNAESKALKTHPAEGKWSVVEVLEHLHRYNTFYIPAFKASMQKAAFSNSEEMRRGSFGMKSAKSMLPTETGVSNPMKTFKSKNSLNSGVSEAIIDTFLAEQEELFQLLTEAKDRDICAVRCKTTLPFIRFKLCDALEFVINHEVRHIAQAKRTLNRVLTLH
jgi:uncharacterized damage-inducible protein DinB